MTLCRSWPLVFIVGAIGSLNATYATAEEKAHAYDRWAIVASPELRKSGLTDLLTVGLSKVDGLELVERERLDVALRELELAALLGARNSADRLKLGKTLGADGLLLLTAGDGGEKSTTVRLVCAECRYGCRLDAREFSFEVKNVERTAGELARCVAEVRARFPKGVELVVGLTPLVSETFVHDYDYLQFGFSRLIAGGLEQRPGVAILEIEEARRIAEELRITAGETIAAMVPVLVEGDFKIDDNAKQTSDDSSDASRTGPTVDLTLRIIPVGANPREFVVKRASLESASRRLAEEVPALILQAAGRNRAETFDRDAQIEHFERRIERSVRLGDYRTASRLYDTILLLDPTDHAMRLGCIRNYSARSEHLREVAYRFSRRRRPIPESMQSEFVECQLGKIRHGEPLLATGRLHPRTALFLTQRIFSPYVTDYLSAERRTVVQKARGRLLRDLTTATDFADDDLDGEFQCEIHGRLLRGGPSDQKASGPLTPRELMKHHDGYLAKKPKPYTAKEHRAKLLFWASSATKSVDAREADALQRRAWDLLREDAETRPDAKSPDAISLGAVEALDPYCTFRNYDRAYLPYPGFNVRRPVRGEEMIKRLSAGKDLPALNNAAKCLHYRYDLEQLFYQANDFTSSRTPPTAETLKRFVAIAEKMIRDSEAFRRRVRPPGTSLAFFNRELTKAIAALRKEFPSLSGEETPTPSGVVEWAFHQKHPLNHPKEIPADYVWLSQRVHVCRDYHRHVPFEGVTTKKLWDLEPGERAAVGGVYCRPVPGVEISVPKFGGGSFRVGDRLQQENLAPGSLEKTGHTVHWAFDGKYLWLATEKAGVFVTTPDGAEMARFGRRQGLLPCVDAEEAAKTVRTGGGPPVPWPANRVALVPLRPGRCLALGAYGERRRVWIDSLDLNSGSPVLKQVHKATKVCPPQTPEANDLDAIFDLRQTTAFPIMLPREDDPSDRGRRTVKIGRSHMRHVLPLEIDVETLKVSVASETPATNSRSPRVSPSLPSEYARREKQCFLPDGRRLIARDHAVHLWTPSKTDPVEWSSETLFSFAHRRKYHSSGARFFFDGRDVYCITATAAYHVDPKTLRHRLLNQFPVEVGQLDQSLFTGVSLSEKWGLVRAQGRSVDGVSICSLVFDAESPESTQFERTYGNDVPVAARDAHHRAVDFLCRRKIEVRRFRHLRPVTKSPTAPHTSAYDTAVVFRAKRPYSDEHLEHLGAIWRLGALQFRETPPSAEQLAAIGNAAKQVADVNFTDVAPDAATLRALTKFPRLDALQLHGAAIDDDVLARIPTLPNLKNFVYSRGRVTAKGVGELKRRIPGLTIYRVKFVRER